MKPGNLSRQHKKRKGRRKNRMKYTKTACALLAAVMMAQSGMTALAAETVSGTDADRVGPGFETDMGAGSGTETGTESQPAAYPMAWERVNGVYMDSTGTPIEGALLRGISVSKWQANIDWGRVAADDVSFALIRMGSFGYEGEYTMDEYYDVNMREAKANGIHTTPYVYLQTRTVEEAREAARYAVQMAAPYEISYPLAVDVESQYLMDLSVQELTDIVNAFCEEVAAAGYTPIVYSDYNKFTTEMDTSQIPYDIWLARYGGDHNYPNRTMWQATDQGQIDGISGNVCLEFAFHDYAASAQSGQTALTPGEWAQENGVWYFYQNGNRLTGWIYPDGNWYYLDPNQGGAMVSGTSMVIDGITYQFNGSGVMQ